MSREAELHHLSALLPAERQQAEKLLELAIANPLEPGYGGFRIALQMGSHQVIAAWLTAYSSGLPYAASDPLWQNAVKELQMALTLEEQRERAAMGFSMDETDIANEEYFQDLMSRDD